MTWMRGTEARTTSANASKNDLASLASGSQSCSNLFGTLSSFKHEGSRIIGTKEGIEFHLLSRLVYSIDLVWGCSYVWPFLSTFLIFMRLGFIPILLDFLPDLLSERISKIALKKIVDSEDQWEEHSIHLDDSFSIVPEVQDHQRYHIKLRGFELHNEESNTVGFPKAYKEFICHGELDIWRNVTSSQTGPIFPNGGFLFWFWRIQPFLSDSIIYDSITCGRYHYTYRDKYCQSKYVWTHVGEDRTVEVVSCHGWRWHTGGHILERQHPVWNADQRNGNIGGERHRRIKYSLWEDQYPSFQ